MKKRLSHLSIFQTSKVFALVYFTLMALFFFPYAVYFLFVRDWESALFAFLAPFFYGGITLMLSLLVVWIYNQIASLTGGIEFVVTEKPTIEEEH
ncbi:MAG: hypothetical protein ACSNEK_01935 [Parachlamydiaceae bacterium]